jgi:hypothetical protein
MPNSLGPSGLTVATQAELIANFTASFEIIYGADIDLSSSSPDGQLMNIFIQALLDQSDLLVQIYNMFDPDNAVGVVLDQRVSINGIQRQAGTFTITPITIVTSQALNLYGLDQTEQPVYTIQDNAGNQWQLETTQNISGAGTYVVNFQAANPGAVLTAINTITIPVTIVLGVTSVNNPTTYTTLGINEETDAALKVRRQKSVSLASQGYLSGLLAALENVSGVTSAFVYENTTATTDGNGVPGHSIWVIVAGTGAAADIANAIYTKRNAGCGMKGTQSYTITQVDGSSFIVLWDDVVTQNLFSAFYLTSIDGINLPNIAAIIAKLPTLFIPSANQEVNINQLATFIQQIDSNALVTFTGSGQPATGGFTVAQTQILTPSGTAASGTFKVSYNGNVSAAINWNDSIGTIQTKVQAVTGLSAALVTGGVSSALTFNLAGITSVLGLIEIVNNGLLTGGSVAITFSYNEGCVNKLAPASKNFQFSVAGANLIALPMQLSPYNSLNATPIQVTHLQTQQFTGLGGYGTLSYAVTTNNSGGSINSSTGLYTAGSTTAVNDTITVTDALGNTATAVVTVV